MSAFLYFIENRSKPCASRGDLESLGLSHAFEGGAPYHGPVSLGPSGESGYLLCNDSMLSDLDLLPQYEKETQTWKRRPDGVWVGMYTHSPPTAIGLERGALIDGERIALNGQSWQVPRVLATLAGGARSTPLPSYLDTDESGEVVPGEVIEKHRWLLDAVTPWFDEWVSQYEEAISEGKEKWYFNYKQGDMAREASKVLSANYYVGLEEMILLKAFTTDRGPYEVMDAAADCEMYESFASKKNRAPIVESEDS